MRYLFSCKRKIINHVSNTGVPEEARSMNNLSVCLHRLLYTEGLPFTAKVKHWEKRFGDHNKSGDKSNDETTSMVTLKESKTMHLGKTQTVKLPGVHKIADDSFELPCCRSAKDEGEYFKFWPDEKKDMEQYG